MTMLTTIKNVLKELDNSNLSSENVELKFDLFKGPPRPSTALKVVCDTHRSSVRVLRACFVTY